jgi:hypothetical protein
MSFREIDVAEVMDILSSPNPSLSAENDRLRDRFQSGNGRSIHTHAQLESLHDLSAEEPLIRLEYDIFRTDPSTVPFNQAS